jgi:hypothetical protein
MHNNVYQPWGHRRKLSLIRFLSPLSWHRTLHPCEADDEEKKEGDEPLAKKPKKDSNSNSSGS